jgi:hypothetical protein
VEGTRIEGDVAKPGCVRAERRDSVLYLETNVRYYRVWQMIEIRHTQPARSATNNETGPCNQLRQGSAQPQATIDLAPWSLHKSPLAAGAGPFTFTASAPPGLRHRLFFTANIRTDPLSDRRTDFKNGL